MDAYRNIILIGMPNSGKSYLGRHLAERYSIPHYDCDAYNPMFSMNKTTKTDWHRFRQYENNILCTLLDKHENKVISTGGGCIEDHRIFHRLCNLSKQDVLIHIICSENRKHILSKNIPMDWESLWMKRGKYYFLVSQYNYWNEGSFHNFLHWFQENIIYKSSSSSV